MAQSIGYFNGDYNNSAIKQFSEQFEDMAGNCKNLPDNDQAALLAVLAVHAWGLKSGLESDFWTNAESAIGDGVETSLEQDDQLDDEEKSSSMWFALKSLETIDNEGQCYALISWLVQ